MRDRSAQSEAINKINQKKREERNLSYGPAYTMMRQNGDHMQTMHVGSLPWSHDLLDLM